MGRQDLGKPYNWILFNNKYKWSTDTIIQHGWTLKTWKVK